VLVSEADVVEAALALVAARESDHEAPQA
jgi:hypothetical protein